MPRVLYALLFLFAFSLIGPYRASAQIIETIEQSVGGGNAGENGEGECATHEVSSCVLTSCGAGSVLLPRSWGCIPELCHP